MYHCTEFAQAKILFVPVRPIFYALFLRAARREVAPFSALKLFDFLIFVLIKAFPPFLSVYPGAWTLLPLQVRKFPLYGRDCLTLAASGIF